MTPRTGSCGAIWKCRKISFGCLPGRSERRSAPRTNQPCGFGHSLLSKHRINSPTTTPVGSPRTQVSEKLGVFAAALFEGEGEAGHMLGAKVAGGEVAVVVGGLG